jgi:hypothetical protein
MMGVDLKELESMTKGCATKNCVESRNGWVLGILCRLL